MKQKIAKPVSPAQARVEGGLFGPILEGVRTRMLPYQWQVLNDEIPDVEKSHCIENFKIAAGRAQGEFYGFVFQDSDLGKWLEAVAYSLMAHPDAELERRADEAVEIMAAAQQPDGYLDTYFICNGLEKRWTNLRDCHELYCAGHLLEGAVAYYEATGKSRALDVLRKYIDYIDTVFGPEEGKLHGYPGHPEIELALCRLYDVTGEERYLRLASYFIETRGQKPFYFEEEQKKLKREFFANGAFGLKYSQSHLPVRQQKTMEGHAVRALYLACGMADVAMRTGDESLLEACRVLFENVTGRRMYVTGGVGSTYIAEAFTFDYDLPGDRAYAETCASVALVFFAGRMLRAELDGRYADAMERALYNTCLAGMSLDMTRYFYVNPLTVWPEADEKDPGKHHVVPERQPWLPCACCPPNLGRLLTSLPEYAVTVEGSRVAVHLYVSGTYQLTVQGQPVILKIETDYPQNGSVRLRLEGKAELALHRPGWCGEYCLKVDGREGQAREEKGYLFLAEPGTETVLEMEMPPVRVYANRRVRDLIGQVAVARGPVVYCAEEADNGDALHLLLLPKRAELKVVPGNRPGFAEIETEGYRILPDERALYVPCLSDRREKTPLRLIPYASWANRGKGEMCVFLRETEE